MTNTPSYDHLTLLGHHASRPANPDEAVLERVANPAAGKHYIVRLTCPEFTSLCPLTGQPDFAHIMIDYIPRNWIVESKSFKLLMGSYRNHGAFHEACTMEIAAKLVAFWTPYGCVSGPTGIQEAAFQSTCSGKPPLRPNDVWIPDAGCSHLPRARLNPMADATSRTTQQ